MENPQTSRLVLKIQREELSGENLQPGVAVTKDDAFVETPVYTSEASQETEEKSPSPVEQAKLDESLSSIGSGNRSTRALFKQDTAVEEVYRQLVLSFAFGYWAVV